MARLRKRHRRRKREALVHQHLENVSRELLEVHPDVVRQFIGRNAGVYALYRKNKLYYVGLATALRGRLRAHVKNRHGGAWDRFSIYLTMRDQHLREIEALLLRIAKPPGAKQRGRLAQSRDMRRRITRRSVKSNSARFLHFSDEKQVLLGARIGPTGRTANWSACFHKVLELGGRLRARFFVLAFDGTARLGLGARHTNRCQLLRVLQSKGQQMAGGFGRWNADAAIGPA